MIFPFSHTTHRSTLAQHSLRPTPQPWTLPGTGPSTSRRFSVGCSPLTSQSFYPKKVGRPRLFRTRCRLRLRHRRLSTTHLYDSFSSTFSRTRATHRDPTDIEPAGEQLVQGKRLARWQITRVTLLSFTTLTSAAWTSDYPTGLLTLGDLCVTNKTSNVKLE